MSNTHAEYETGWFCHNRAAGFEPQEARQNDNDCPWCGESVAVGE